MVCRSTPGNSALTTHARLASGLHDVQVLSLFHEIRAEIPRNDRGQAPQEEVHRVLGDVMTSVAEDDRFSPARRRSMAERVSQSMERPVDSRTFHAWQNIEERSVRAAAAMNTHFEAIARRHACTPGQAQARFNEMMHRDYRVDGQAPVAPEHVTFSLSNLPQDEHTRHALAMLYDAGPSHLDTEDRRLQAQARILATSTEITNGTHPAATGAANQCPDCGQFAAANHVCLPTQDEPAEDAINRTLRATRQIRDGEERFAVMSRHALSRVGAEPTDLDRGREMLRASMERLSRSNGITGDWVTTRGQSYSSLEEANLRQFEIDCADAVRPHEAAATDTQPLSRCSGCGQYASEDHTCPAPATNPDAPSSGIESAALLADLRGALGDTLYDDEHGYDRRLALLNQFTDAYISDRDTRDFTIGALRRDITYNPIGGHYDTRDGRSYETEEEIVAERFTNAWDAGSRPCPTCQYLHVPGGCGPHGYRIVTPAMDAYATTAVEGLPSVARRLNAIADTPGHEGRMSHVVAATIQETTGMSESETLNLLSDLRGEVSPADQSWDHPGFMSAYDTFHATREQAAFATFTERWQSGHRRCPGCGQFAAPDHTCPQGGLADRGDSTPEATPAPRVVPAAQPATPPITHAGATGAGPARGSTATATRQRTALRTYAYDAPDGTRIETRTLNLSALRQEASNLPDGAAFLPTEVAARITDGQTSYEISGTVSVVDTGGRIGRYRDRFQAVMVVDEEAAETNGGHTRSLRCTCPAYQANYDCEHLRQTTSHLQGMLNRREAPAVAPRAAVEAVEADLRAEYNNSLDAQQQARAAFSGAAAGASYSQDMDAFQSAWEEARDHFGNGNTDLPYMRENATGGLGAREGGRSFGIEIEVDFPDDMSYTAKESVAREIYEAGLSQSPYVQGWHYIGRAGGGYTDAPNNWSVEYDRSVDGLGGRRGCEIVSPILYDEPQTWQNLEKVCEIVQRHGGQVTARTGLHVNVGAADFDHTVENHNRLLRLGMGYEDVLIRTSHNPQSAPRHRGRDYCRPMAVPAEGYASIRGAQRSVDPYSDNGSSHRAMINLDHVPAEGQSVTSSTRVEVRVFDGAVDPGRIQTNVKVALGLVNAAARGAATPDTTEAAGAHRSANMGSNGRMRRLSGDEWRADTASFRSLADTIFTREEDKRQFTYAFAATRWQAGADQFSRAYTA